MAKVLISFVVALLVVGAIMFALDHSHFLVFKI